MLKNLFRDRQAMLSIGMIALIVANISHFLIHPAGHIAQDLSDGVYGMLIGISIGFNLLSLRLRVRA